MSGQFSKKLEEINENIRLLQEERYVWIWENYMAFAKFAIGDKIYARVAANDYKLQIAGVVTSIELDRFISEDKKLSMTTPDIVYHFTPVSSYHYGSDTKGGWSHFYNESDWKRECEMNIEQIRRSMA